VEHGERKCPVACNPHGQTLDRIKFSQALKEADATAICHGCLDSCLHDRSTIKGLPECAAKPPGIPPCPVACVPTAATLQLNATFFEATKGKTDGEKIDMCRSCATICTYESDASFFETSKLCNLKVRCPVGCTRHGKTKDLKARFAKALQVDTEAICHACSQQCPHDVDFIKSLPECAEVR